MNGPCGYCDSRLVCCQRSNGPDCCCEPVAEYECTGLCAADQGSATSADGPSTPGPNPTDPAPEVKPVLMTLAKVEQRAGEIRKERAG